MRNKGTCRRELKEPKAASSFRARRNVFRQPNQKGRGSAVPTEKSAHDGSVHLFCHHALGWHERQLSDSYGHSTLSVTAPKHFVEQP